MKRLRRKLPAPGTVIGVVALVVACTGGAYAAGKIGSDDIKADAIKSKHIAQNQVTGSQIANEVIKAKHINPDDREAFLAGGGTLGAPGAPGAQGPAGPAGADGAAGAAGAAGANGADAAYVGENWTQNLRNTDPGADAYLGAGPVVATGPSSVSEPPYGVGSLVLNNDASEASHFSNEVDFLGDNVADLDEVAYSVFTTGENATRGEPMPNVKIEIDPNLNSATTTPDYSTLVYVPQNNAVVNQWGPEINAAGEDGSWYLTGQEGPAISCANAGADCSLDDIQAGLAGNNNGTPAKILTVGVGKGRDTGFVGAVDGLQINDTVYNFEPFGVYEEDAS